MFQRLKGAIDSRIAEEQARQRTLHESPSRSNSRTQRSSSRNLSSSRRTIRSEGRESRDGELSAKGPDPSEFEPDFVIGGDDTPSRSSTPRPIPEKSETAPDDGASAGVPLQAETKETPKKLSKNDAFVKPAELPADVRVKLRKLEKLESRYHELLRSYRLAHARVLSIEPFETSLRENTPLTSISDPSALVEYLNQVNLKGDMVLDELKRVSTERDFYKQKLEKAEQSTRDAWDEVTNLRKGTDLYISGDDSGKEKSASEKISSKHDSANGESVEAIAKSPTTLIKSRISPVPNLSLFSPKSKATGSPVMRKGSEDLFSYDSELPRMESELEEKEEKINNLGKEVQTLKADLAVARESTQSMVQTLEEATRELSVFKESTDRSQTELQEHRVSSENLLDQVKAKLQNTEDSLNHVRDEHGSCKSGRIAELEGRLEEANAELIALRSHVKKFEVGDPKAEQLSLALENIETKTTDLEAVRLQDKKRIETLNDLVRSLQIQLSDLEERDRNVASESKATKAHLRTNDAENITTPNSADALPASAENTTTSKKKNKKKKKGGRPGPEQMKEVNSGVVQETVDEGSQELDGIIDANSTIARIEAELEQFRKLLEKKDEAIERMHGKLQDQDALKEEIESLRDDIVNVGQGHVQAKDNVKSLQVEKAALQSTVEDLENELTTLHATQVSTTAGSEQKHNELTAQFEELKVKATALQTDLAAAQQLASSRFKDLSDLRSVLQKAQPELTSLRSEVLELRSVKEDFGKRNAEFTRLETQHKQLCFEITGLKQIISERDSDIKTLNQKIIQEENTRLGAEESGSKAVQEIQRLEIERRQASESLDRLSQDLAKAREEINTTRKRLQEVELQTSQLYGDNEGLKEDMELKTAQHASAQSLMSSMRDQTAEMAMQTKEARERCESLEEEVAEAHRLLSERSREGETMRRLLADVEGRADTRFREMKERMDTAIEERDRAEDEASTLGRRRARELEDLRNKVRDIERSLKRAEEDKEELEMAQRDWKRRRDELEAKTEQSTSEADEIRKAMGELRDALNESERQTRELEKQKFELRRSVEETQHRLEKLQKSNKSMADDIRAIQTAKTKAIDSEAQSSRSSIDSNLSRARLGSPTPKSKPGFAIPIDSANGPGAAPIDFVYLKNVLLQFLEQKDKKHQQQLIPVLGMLLHFDRKDEQKWMSAIVSK